MTLSEDYCLSFTYSFFDYLFCMCIAENSCMPFDFMQFPFVRELGLTSLIAASYRITFPFSQQCSITITTIFPFLRCFCTLFSSCLSHKPAHNVLSNCLALFPKLPPVLTINTLSHLHAPSQN